MQRAPLADHQQDRVAASLAVRRVAGSPHGVDHAALDRSGRPRPGRRARPDRRRAPVRRGPRHQVRDVRRAPRARRDDRRAAPRRLAARRPPRAPRARSRARSSCAASSAPSRRSPTWPARRRRRGAPRAHDRPHQHDRIDVAAGELRDDRQRRRCRPCSCRASRRRRDRCSNRREMRDRVRSALAQLPARERRIISLYYFGEATMKQIGARDWRQRIARLAAARARDSAAAARCSRPAPRRRRPKLVAKPKRPRVRRRRDAPAAKRGGVTATGKGVRAAEVADERGRP